MKYHSCNCTIITCNILQKNTYTTRDGYYTRYTLHTTDIHAQDTTYDTLYTTHDIYYTGYTLHTTDIHAQDTTYDTLYTTHDIQQTLVLRD